MKKKLFIFILFSIINNILCMHKIINPFKNKKIVENVLKQQTNMIMGSLGIVPQYNFMNKINYNQNNTQNKISPKLTQLTTNFFKNKSYLGLQNPRFPITNTLRDFKTGKKDEDIDKINNDQTIIKKIIYSPDYKHEINKNINTIKAMFPYHQLEMSKELKNTITFVLDFPEKKNVY
jgi:hypothetical protein